MTEEMYMDTIKIWTEDAQASGTKSALPSLARAAVAKTVEVSGDVLREGIKGFAAQFAALLDGTPIGEGGVLIDEIELSLTVTASGGVELLGKVSLGTQAAIKVKLKRQPVVVQP
ncbi:hypothetical protein YQ44_18760 [Janthinobacterium sp. 1_2014MBL_MicDiv]|nr:hypothetical protein YQ44_18760 [Janthinobacterium sp. 1_2014MBL_MicDiv]